MNAQSLVNRVQRRVPGYQQYEYLDEINHCYQQCWDAILQLEDSYFTQVKQVTAAQLGTEFDFLYNENGNLQGPVSNRYFQITRIRVLPPGGTAWCATVPRSWNDPDFLSQQQNANPQIQLSGPFFYVPLSKGSVVWGLPQNAGTTFEVTYNFVFLDLRILSNGTIASAGTAVTGTSTNFTQILGPDYQANLPGDNEDTEVGVELVLPVSGAGQTPSYRVASILTDTSLTTQNAIATTLSNSNYILASVPDIPQGHHDCIASLATRNILSSPANDSRYSEWDEIAQQQFQSMKDSIMVRQKQRPPQRQRFPFSVFGSRMGSLGNR